MTAEIELWNKINFSFIWRLCETTMDFDTWSIHADSWIWLCAIYLWGMCVCLHLGLVWCFTSFFLSWIADRKPLTTSFVITWKLLIYTSNMIMMMVCCDSKCSISGQNKNGWLRESKCFLMFNSMMLYSSF